MKNEISSQLVQAGISFAWGMGAGWVYDFFALIRRKIKNKAVTALCDGLYWLLCGVGFLLVSYALCGKTRIFMILLSLCGGALYFSWLRGLGTAIWRLFFWPMAVFRKIMMKSKEKIHFFQKNIFSTWKNRFKIDNNHHGEV